MLKNTFKKLRESTLMHDCINLLFPQQCILCGRRGSLICLSCRGSLHTAQESSQEKEAIRSSLSYKDTHVQHILWLLKYRGIRTLAPFCAEMLYERLLEDMDELSLFLDFKNPLFVPIPLSKKRLRFRGFNQSALIAEALCNLYQEGELGSGVLEKIRETKPQMTLRNKNERLKNITGCFAVKNPERVCGRNIILIDDITTTGATFREARHVLYEAGAHEVVCYSVAH